MQGYWNAPEETSRTFRIDPVSGARCLLYIGDLFRKDEEGYLYYVARKDDIIKTKGERVSPKEIENMLCEFLGVQAAAVIGVPDRIDGSAIKAFIVPARGQTLNEKKLLRHCAANLEPFMVPKYVAFRESLPKLPNGKIDKKKLDHGDDERRKNGERRKIGKEAEIVRISAFQERRITQEQRSGVDRRSVDAT